jgi:hypothetical protein
MDHQPGKQRDVLEEVGRKRVEPGGNHGRIGFVHEFGEEYLSVARTPKAHAQQGGPPDGRVRAPGGDPEAANRVRAGDAAEALNGGLLDCQVGIGQAIDQGVDCRLAWCRSSSAGTAASP